MVTKKCFSEFDFSERERERERGCEREREREGLEKNFVKRER